MFYCSYVRHEETVSVLLSGLLLCFVVLMSVVSETDSISASGVCRVLHLDVSNQKVVLQSGTRRAAK